MNKNKFYISSLLLFMAFSIFQVENLKAYYDCSKYGPFAYSDGSGYCKCTSGYVMDKDFMGAPYCVSGLTYCYDKYGFNSEYDLLSNSCKCRYGYIWKYNTYGGKSCIY